MFLHTRMSYRAGGECNKRKPTLVYTTSLHDMLTKQNREYSAERRSGNKKKDDIKINQET